MNNLTVINSKPGNEMSTYMMKELFGPGESIYISFKGVQENESSKNEDSTYLNGNPNRDNILESVLKISKALNIKKYCNRYVPKRKIRNKL